MFNKIEQKENVNIFKNQLSDQNLEKVKSELYQDISSKNIILVDKYLRLTNRLQKYHKLLSLLNREYTKLTSVNEKIAKSIALFKHKCIVCDAYGIKKIKGSTKNTS